MNSMDMFTSNICKYDLCSVNRRAVVLKKSRSEFVLQTEKLQMKHALDKVALLDIGEKGKT